MAPEPVQAAASSATIRLPGVTALEKVAVPDVLRAVCMRINEILDAPGHERSTECYIR